MYRWYERWFVTSAQPAQYDLTSLESDVIAEHVEPTAVGRARFDVTRQHVNPFGALHGGCHAMLMELTADAFVQAEKLTTSSVDGTASSSSGSSNSSGGVVRLQAMQLEFFKEARGTVDIVCDWIGNGGAAREEACNN